MGDCGLLPQAYNELSQNTNKKCEARVYHAMMASQESEQGGNWLNLKTKADIFQFVGTGSNTGELQNLSEISWFV